MVIKAYDCARHGTRNEHPFAELASFRKHYCTTTPAIECLVPDANFINVIGSLTSGALVVAISSIDPTQHSLTSHPCNSIAFLSFISNKISCCCLLLNTQISQPPTHSSSSVNKEKQGRWVKRYHVRISI